MAVQEPDDVERVFAGGAQAVHGDHPGVPYALHQPGGQHTELGGDLDVLVVEAERLLRGAVVELWGEPDPVPRLRGAPGDPLQAAHHGVRRMRHVDDLADHRADAGTLDPVRPGAQRGQAPGQGDPPGPGGVHGELGVGGQRAAWRRLEGRVARVPSGGHRCRADADECGDGRCRRCSRAHRSSVGSARPHGQWAGAYRGTPGPGASPCPYPRNCSAARSRSAPESREGVRPGTEEAASQRRHIHSSWAVRSYAWERVVP